MLEPGTRLLPEQQLFSIPIVFMVYMVILQMQGTVVSTQLSFY